MKTKPHRKRKGWDCPHCKMHFGWGRQYAAHIEGKHCQDNGERGRILPLYLNGEMQRFTNHKP